MRGLNHLAILKRSMTLSGQKVYVCGRLRGFTRRRIGELAAANGINVARRPAVADTLVLAHGTEVLYVTDAGELRPGREWNGNARLASERCFLSALGLVAARGPAGSAHSEAEVVRHSGLSAQQLRTLSLYDVLGPSDGGFAYNDLVAARAAGRLFAAGARFPKIIAAALALVPRGLSLSNVRLAEAPWGELLREFEGALAEIDGQLLLPLEGSDVDALEAFAQAEASEQEGDLEAARRWYDLAARLDESDPVIPFNLGNVLDELGRSREAEFAYRRAIERSPELADAWFNLGVLQEKMGRESEALASYNRAFAVEPGYADALHNAGLLLMRQHRFAAALPLLESISLASPAQTSEARLLAQLCRLELRRTERGGA
jgi:tetratricopeptide (TPR) repeat protein